MRCPKCGYISFDHLTSCGKCSNDLAELSASLKGTGFQSLNTFFLGGLIADFDSGGSMAPTGDIPSFDQEIPDMPIADDLGDPSGLNLDMNALNDLGDIADLPESDDLGELNIDADELSLDGLEVPDMDLSQFEDGGDDDGPDHGFSAGGDDLDLSDQEIPDMALDEVEFDAASVEDEAGEPGSSATDATQLDIPAGPADDDLELGSLDDDLSMDEDLSLTADSDLDMADDADLSLTDEMDLSMDEPGTVSADEEPAPPSVDLADIDLSLGDDEQAEPAVDDEVMDLAELDLGDAVLNLDKDGEALEQENTGLPDLELE